MAIRPPEKGGRLTAISLQAVPPQIRRRYGQRFLELAFADGDLDEALDWHKAIEEPSSHQYLISEAAVRRVLG